MNYARIRASLRDWYNRKIVAKWYRSSVLITGWLVAAVAYLPDLLQFGIEHFDFFAGLVLPTLSPVAKAALLGFFVTFIAPPLRAWAQKSMQEANIKQLAQTDKVIPLPASGVSAKSMRPEDLLTDGELRAELAARAEGRARLGAGDLG